jgi:lipopolysaccharide/colanic/teichoic acid biosynthesis glycosyltransferase
MIKNIQATMERASSSYFIDEQNFIPGAAGQLVYRNFQDPWLGFIRRGFPVEFYSFSKRFIDILAAGIIFILSLPIMIITSCLIKLDSPGPVFFKQIRIGKNRRNNINNNGPHYERRKENLKGKPFMIYKFRTMRTDAKAYDIKPSDKSDSRITRVGKILRATCLDELPQIINVLKGDLSMVGPRPEMPFIVKNYSHLEALRLKVKPGITGLWQLYAPRTQRIHENLQYDLHYLNKRSILFDIKIMFKTLGYMVRLQNV